MKIVSRVLVYIFLGSRGVCIVYMPLVWGSRSRLGACLLSCVYLCGWD